MSQGTYHSFYFPDPEVYEKLQKISERHIGNSASAIVFGLVKDFIERDEKRKDSAR